MIPAKRASPFVRSRSFQNTKARKEGQDPTQTDSFPLSKRAGFARTMSSPFQVLSPSLKTTKNPFEKLNFSSMNSEVTLNAPNYAAGEGEGDSEEDEALDPNQTLKMFSFSQTTTAITATTTTTTTSRANSTKDSDVSDDEDDGEEDEDEDENVLEEETHDGDTAEVAASQTHSGLGNADILWKKIEKPRLHEALAMSGTRKRQVVSEELHAPKILGGSTKKLGTEYKTSHTVPLDWTLKTSLSITSPDSLTWCDQSSTMDEIEALQSFVSSPESLRLSEKSKEVALLSARTRLLAATYHWIYPTNSPTIPQAQSISRLLKNAGNMSSGEKGNISDLFSRSSEWKQSFKALYQSCRNEACPYFYYVGTAWTVLFQHGSVSMSGEMEAVLTYSTPGLRKVLQEEEIEFERVPDVVGKTTVHNFSSKHDLENFDDHYLDAADSPATNKAPLVQPEMHDLSDVLLFKGQVHVHGLFSYLLDLKTSYEDGFLYQSPSLIADVPFLHSGLKRATISKCRVVSKHVEGTESQMQREFRVDIQGTLLPTSTREICKIFTSQQPSTGSGYSCIASSDARSLGLNLRPLLLSSDEDQDRTRASDIHAALISPKALDQLRYDHDLKQYLWLS